MSNLLEDSNYKIVEEKDLDQYPYHKWWYERYSKELKAYIKKALENGAKLAITDPSANGIDVVMKSTDNKGETLYIIQGLYNDPTENTFILTTSFNTPINRRKECKGIPIWNTRSIVEKALVCPKCGKKVDSFDQLHFILYAGAECEECSVYSQMYIDSKPNGFWTC